MMDSPDLESLLEHFSDKIETISELVPLARLCNHKKDATGNQASFCRRIQLSTEVIEQTSSEQQSDVVLPDLAALTEMVFEMKEMMCDIKSQLSSQRRGIDKQREQSYLRIAALKEHLKYLKGNLPPFFGEPVKEPAKASTQAKGPATVGSRSALVAKNGKSVVKSAAPAAAKVATTKKVLKPSNGVARVPSATVAPKTAAKPPKKIPEREREVKVAVPPVEFVTTDEFEGIPPYMRGRLNYEAINRAVGDFNRALTAKYRVVALGNKCVDDDMKKFALYKSQENAETSGEFFCTMSDLTQLSDLKADNMTKIVLTCLRHCRRIKEIRGPVKLIRYAVVQRSAGAAGDGEEGDN